MIKPKGKRISIGYYTARKDQPDAHRVCQVSFEGMPLTAARPDTPDWVAFCEQYARAYYHKTRGRRRLVIWDGDKEGDEQEKTLEEAT